MSKKEAEDSDENALIRMEGYERWISQCFNYACRSLIVTLQRKLRSPYSMYSYSPSPNENVSRLEKQGRSISTLLYSTLPSHPTNPHHQPPFGHRLSTLHTLHLPHHKAAPSPSPSPVSNRPTNLISAPTMYVNPLNHPTTTQPPTTNKQTNKPNQTKPNQTTDTKQRSSKHQTVAEPYSTQPHPPCLD